MNVIIWDVHPETCTLSLKKILEGHNYGIENNEINVHFEIFFFCSGASYISWNPDSVHLIACGPEESPKVWLWNTETEKLLMVSQSPEDALACCAWHKDGTKFVVSLMEKKLILK